MLKLVIGCKDTCKTKSMKHSARRPPDRGGGPTRTGLSCRPEARAMKTIRFTMPALACGPRHYEQTGALMAPIPQLRSGNRAPKLLKTGRGCRRIMRRQARILTNWRHADMSLPRKEIGGRESLGAILGVSKNISYD
jgi:hypothetical protein